MFRDGWVEINSVPTHVSTWGGWIEDEIESDAVLLCIPGNPGIPEFYYCFLKKLHSLIGIPTWVINHAGCVPGNKTRNQPSIDDYPDLYTLSGQIEQKKEFIKKYVPGKKKLFLIGHSVGGKMCIELMKDNEIAERVEQVQLVFPTLQHIRESPNGKWFMAIIQHIIPVIVTLAWIFTVLPLSFRHQILSVYFWMRRDWKNCHKESCLEGVLKLFTAHTSKASLILAKDEMSAIKDLDTEIYDNYWDKIHCYYAQGDRWAPLFQYKHLMKTHPKIQGEILDRKFTHAFVLTTPVDMAEKLSDGIHPRLQKLSAH